MTPKKTDTPEPTASKLGPVAAGAGAPSLEPQTSESTVLSSAETSLADKAPPRGVLKPPPEVEDVLTEELRDQPASAAFRQQLAAYLTLRYYCGGHHIAYRVSPEGPEVLAVGLGEMAELNQRLSPEQRAGISVGRPEPW
jgi:hypothetical protein